MGTASIISPAKYGLGPLKSWADPTAPDIDDQGDIHSGPVEHLTHEQIAIWNEVREKLEAAPEPPRYTTLKALRQTIASTYPGDEDTRDRMVALIDREFDLIARILDETR